MFTYNVSTTQTFLDEYSGARTKVDKSAVLNKVVEEVRLRSPNGGFVKQDADGVWHEVGDFLAREKTSQAFRDALHDRYKSSNVSKKKRRQEEQAKVTTKPRGNSVDYDMTTRLERLSNEVMLGRTYKTYISLNGSVVHRYRADLTLPSPSRFAEGIDNIDDFNRSNYEMLTRLNRMSHAKGSTSSPSGPYGPRRSSYGRSYQQDFPDPLFGASANAAAIAHRPPTSHEDRLTPGSPYQPDPRMTMRQFSFATAPEPSVDPLPYARLDPTSFHQSLPNIHYQQPDDQSDPFDDDDQSLHQSMPNIALQQHSIPEHYSSGKVSSVKSMEPIPFHRINLKGRPKEADDPSSTTKKPPAAAMAMPEESISGTSTSHTRLSRDLIECLDKMTCHTIHDGNPFEPIPLTPRQEREIAARRHEQQQQQHQQQLLTTSLKPLEELSTDSFPSGDAEPMDESERIDEFAEG
jgi:hypothetical protein